MLYVVPTPIGNLRDITLRALEVLKSADAIICEDTRRTGLLLKHYEIAAARLISFHEHSPKARVEEIAAQLKEGKNFALVSDGGTPLISDPGYEIVRAAIHAGIRVEALPGASAVTTALVASGLAPDAFTFLSFLPQKSSARRRKLQAVKDREETLIFYESPYRAGKVLGEMLEIFGNREAVVARELTKKFEEISRGCLSELAQKFSKKKIRGEIVILISGKGRKNVLHGP